MKLLKILFGFLLPSKQSKSKFKAYLNREPGNLKISMKTVDMSQSSYKMHNHYLLNKLNNKQLQNIIKNLTDENNYLHKRLRYFKWKSEENESSVGYLEKEVAHLKDYVHYYEHYYYYSDNPNYNSSSNHKINNYSNNADQHRRYDNNNDSFQNCNNKNNENLHKNRQTCDYRTPLHKSDLQEYGQQSQPIKQKHQDQQQQQQQKELQQHLQQQQQQQQQQQKQHRQPQYQREQQQLQNYDNKKNYFQYSNIQNNECLHQNKQSHDYQAPLDKSDLLQYTQQKQMIERKHEQQLQQKEQQQQQQQESNMNQTRQIKKSDFKPRKPNLIQETITVQTNHSLNSDKNKNRSLIYFPSLYENETELSSQVKDSIALDSSSEDCFISQRVVERNENKDEFKVMYESGVFDLV